MVTHKKVIVEEEEEKAKTPEVEGTPSEEVSEEKESLPAETENISPSDSEQESPPGTEETPKEEPLGAEMPPKKKDRSLLAAGLIIALFIFGVTGWVLYLTNRFTEKTAEEVATTEVVETPEESTLASTQTQLLREEISLEILNGSGVSGVAAETAAIFKDLGYEVVEIDNADETEGNQLYVNAEVEDLIDVLLEDVEDELDISSISGELEDSSASARIILGK